MKLCQIFGGRVFSLIADASPIGSTGRFGATVQPSGVSRIGIIDFIASHLPSWRDDIRRPPENSEDGLSDQLCKYLNRISRRALGYDRYQFNREAKDLVERSRNLDIEVSPAEDEIYVDGQLHDLYETVLAIECKRLPIPWGKDRDEREYVITAGRTTGGIQRFRRGDHGSTQPIVGMIGYVQEGSCAEWIGKVNAWITALTFETGELQWTNSDHLVPQNSSDAAPYRAKSVHGRLNDLDEVQIYHLWIQMNTDSTC